MIQRLKKIIATALFLGALSTGQAAEVFPFNAELKFLKGLSEASSPDPASWRALNFNDTSGTAAPSPFW